MEQTSVVVLLLEIIVGLIVSIVGLIAFFDVWFALRAIRRETEGLGKMVRLMALAASGQSLVGRTAVTQGTVNPHTTSGQVIIDGEYWNCWAENAIPAGTKVSVKALVGLNLCVEAVSAPKP
jgi:membrane protein implicated in regulation of membrane protease activity